MNLLSVRDAITILKEREKAKYIPEDKDLMTLDEAREEFKEKTIMGQDMDLMTLDEAREEYKEKTMMGRKLRKYPTHKIDLKFLIL